MIQQVRPKSLRLEATTFCQLKCPSCETAQGKTHTTLGGGFLKFEHFKKIVDENPWLSHIELSNWGEIFLNPDLIQIMEYAYKKNVALTAGNGVNLNTVKEQALEALVKYKFRYLSCSIDGASQETYSIYRRGGNFDRVIENIKTINRYKEKYQSEFPVLRWQFVVFGHNEHEIEAAQALAQQLNMQLFIKLSWDEEFSPIKDVEKVRQVSGVGAASRSEFFQQNGTGYLQKSFCSQLWKLPQVNWDGRVLGCCYNYWGDFGNAFESGLKHGLNNDKINHARQMLMGQAEPKADIPCTTCGHYKRMQETNDWLTMDDIRPSRREKLAAIFGRLKAWFVNHVPLGAKLYHQLSNRL